MELSIRMRGWREALGLSQTRLAKSAGTTAPAISHIERGKANPSVAMLTAIVGAMGLTMKRFYDDDELIRAEREAKRRARAS